MTDGGGGGGGGGSMSAGLTASAKDAMWAFTLCADISSKLFVL